MPRRAGTGLRGAGSMSGRGFGLCTGANAAVRNGTGRRGVCRSGVPRGFGRGFAINQTSSKTPKELLREQKTILQDQLEVIDKQLDRLK